jgi:hypothetical protein
LFFLILTLPLLSGCSSRQPFSYDFETDDTLDALQWKCKTVFSLSKKHSTSGKKSLKIELYPSSYPGITLSNFNPDWSKHTILTFAIYNEEQIPLRLNIRIDDKKDPSYSNRYKHTIILKYGMNHISIPLNSLRTTKTDKKIDLTNVLQIILFLSSPEEKRVIYLDNVRLE